ncbi:hypothetical protein BDV93DRAFT_605735 [Ceratobasidium sp. AG-I]|nr:hypothetical protein BDV93DRAFT_605735 [Ceratobasidium sp. AG-I]
MTTTGPGAADYTNLVNHTTPASMVTITDPGATIDSAVAAGTTNNAYLPKRSALGPLKKDVVTILLIGETGSGKTSLMSLLVNLFQGNGPFELTDQHDPTKESGLSQAHSQTTGVKLYTVTTADGTTVQILDTPGLADTNGIDKDDEHKAKINNGIRDFIESIDAVLIVANGTVPRLGAATNYTLSVISSIFPYSIIDNICFVFTNSDLCSLNFQMDDLQPELRGSKWWAIQNPLPLHKSYKTKVENRAPACVLETWSNKLKGRYQETVQTLNGWLAWLDERKVQPTKDINDLYQTSIRIESHIEAALSALTRLHEDRQRWKQIESDLKDAETRKGALENLAAQATEPYWDRQASERPNTICIAADCYQNCHAPCGCVFLNNSAVLGMWCSAFPSDPLLRPTLSAAAAFPSLAAALPFLEAVLPIAAAFPSMAVALPVGLLLMGWRAHQAGSLNCNICGHEAKQHRHYMSAHVQVPREIDPQMQEALDEATTEEGKLAAAFNTVNQELERTEGNIHTTQENTRRLIDEYNVVSLSKSFSGHIRSAIQMLKYRQEELESKPDTATELDLIKESINKLEEKLKVLRGEGQNESEPLVIAPHSLGD